MKNQTKAQANTIVAVSGGVDSVVMLHLFVCKDGPCKNRGDSDDFVSSFARTDLARNLVVAHFDHGIREDSAADTRFVEALAKKHGLAFELGQGELGPRASENTARRARHSFLESVRSKYKADKIATAHHRDDVVETAIINVLRGTGRRGLSSLRETQRYARPLINMTKSEIYSYALKHKLEWVHDETNDSDDYLRNRVRSQVVPKLKNNGDYKKLEKLIDWFRTNNPIIDEVLEGFKKIIVEKTSDHTALPISIFDDEIVAKELAYSVVHDLGALEIDKVEIQRLVEFAHSANNGDKFNQLPPLVIEKNSGWLLLS